MGVSSGDVVTLLPIESYNSRPITDLTMEIRPLSRQETLEIDLDQFIEIVKEQFSGLIVTEGFQLIIGISGKSFICDVSNFKFDKGEASKHGLLMGSTHITCREHPQIHFKKVHRQQHLFKDSVDLPKMGIGGLSKEFALIFRRLFASRLLPSDTLHEMNINHIRGMIIHGPPGCGKTLLARQIGRILNCADIKVVNGPELLNMYVGESESNTRKLFENAINDKEGRDLHLIICDEFDALCRTRGMTIHNSPVLDNVVNTLLSYIDGINQLNNILMICMTNRIDLIDPAMLRPGRLELQIEVALPDEIGRQEILTIHTSAMKEKGYLDLDVKFDELAIKTKNFTGAEIEGLVKCASSYAIARVVNVDGNQQTPNTSCASSPHASSIGTITSSGVVPGLGLEILEKALNKKLTTSKPIVTMDDFTRAFDDIKPMFGNISNDIMEITKNPLIFWSPIIRDTFGHLIESINELHYGHSLSVVIEGQPYIGKTFMACHLIKQLHPSYARIISPLALIGKQETEKSHYIHQIFDCSDKSEFSIIVIDMFERLIEWCSMGSLLNNQILQVLLTLIRKNLQSNSKLVLITTCYDYSLMKKLEIENLFNFRVTLPHRINSEGAKLLDYETKEDVDLQTVLRSMSKHSKI